MLQPSEYRQKARTGLLRHKLHKYVSICIKLILLILAKFPKRLLGSQ